MLHEYVCVWTNVCVSVSWWCVIAGKFSSLVSHSLCYAKEAQSVPPKFRKLQSSEDTVPFLLILSAGCCCLCSLVRLAAAHFHSWHTKCGKEMATSRGRGEWRVESAWGAVKSFAGCDSCNSGKLSAEFRHHCISVCTQTLTHTHTYTERGIHTHGAQ